MGVSGFPAGADAIPVSALMGGVPGVSPVLDPRLISRRDQRCPPLSASS